MGSNNAKAEKRKRLADQFADLYVQLDTVNFRGGDTATGKVYITIKQDFPGNQLFLKFKGTEHAYLVRTESSDKSTSEVLHSQHKTRVKHTIPIHSWDSLSAGQYIIPFSFLIPRDLPNSFYQQGYRYLGCVQYTVGAFLRPLDKKGPRPKVDVSVNIQEPFINVQNNIAKETSFKISTCCCCSKGFATLKATFNTNSFSLRDVATITMEFDNTQSKLSNKIIECLLMQKVTLKPWSYEKQVIKTFKKLTGAGLGTTSGQKNMSLTLPSSWVDTRPVDRKNIKTHLLNLQESFVLNPATNGQTVTSEYYLEVMCEMEGCCSSKPKITIPIGINLPGMTNRVQGQPALWNTQQSITTTTITPVNAVITSSLPPIKHIDMSITTKMCEPAMVGSSKLKSAYPVKKYLVNDNEHADEMHQ